MSNYEINDLELFLGKDIEINSGIVLHIPTLLEISRYGEKEYFSTVSNFTATGADLKWQLWDVGVDFSKIDDYQLFLNFTRYYLGSKKLQYAMIIRDKNEKDKYDSEYLEDLLINPLGILLKDKNGNPIDLADFKDYEDKNQVILYNEQKDITFDYFAFLRIVDILRKIHNFKRNSETPMNEATRDAMIEDARSDYLANANKPFKSVIKPLLSSVVVSCGIGVSQALSEMKISTLFELVARISKMEDANHLIQGAYSGMVDMKGVDTNRFNWMSDNN